MSKGHTQPSPARIVCVCARVTLFLAASSRLSHRQFLFPLFFPSSFPLDRLTSTCSKICSIRLLPSGLCLRDLVRDKRERVCVPSSSSVWIYT